MGLLILVHLTFSAHIERQALSDFVSPAAYFFFGGVLMIIGSIGEWIVGNTFPFVVFGTFGKLPPLILSLRSQK